MGRVGTVHCVFYICISWEGCKIGDGTLGYTLLKGWDDSRGYVEIYQCIMITKCKRW